MLQELADLRQSEVEAELQRARQRDGAETGARRMPPGAEPSERAPEELARAGRGATSSELWR